MNPIKTLVTRAQVTAHNKSVAMGPLGRFAVYSVTGAIAGGPVPVFGNFTGFVAGALVGLMVNPKDIDPQMKLREIALLVHDLALMPEEATERRKVPLQAMVDAKRPSVETRLKTLRALVTDKVVPEDEAEPYRKQLAAKVPPPPPPPESGSAG